MSITLIKLTKEYEKELLDMYDEWTNDQKVNHTNHSPWAIFKNDPHKDFDYYLKNLECDHEKDGHVPDTTLFLYDDKRDRLLGAANIRHYLNEDLMLTGGHIGDGIRPSERRKGYATLLVKLALEECKKLGIKSVLMCCSKDNIGSAKSITRNGGVFEDEVFDGDEICQRYWIDLF